MHNYYAYYSYVFFFVNIHHFIKCKKIIHIIFLFVVKFELLYVLSETFSTVENVYNPNDIILLCF